MTKFWKILIEGTRYGYQIMNDNYEEVDLREEDGRHITDANDYAVVEENVPAPSWWVDPV